MLKRIAIASVLMGHAAVAAATGQLRDVRVWDGPESTRVVFDLTEASPHKVFTLSNPDRVVIDIDNVHDGGAKLAAKAAGGGVVQKVRGGSRGAEGLRVVLDVGQTVKPRSFALEPNEEYGYRLVLDLHIEAKEAAAVNEAAAMPTEPVPVQQQPTPKVEARAEPKVEPKFEPKLEPKLELKEKPIVVAVDAGHGGEDPGARGKSGLLEKEVTLAISKRLVALINAEPGMKAVLTREKDYYVGLRDRVNKARRAQADLFVSVHANAFKDSDMHGTAVYTLSNRGATSEQARWLANKENAADMVGGVEINDKDDDLAKVLIDLSQDATMEASFDIGERVLHAMGKINKLQKRAVQQAGFAVLKAPDIPSILVETAFITNEHEEQMLGDQAKQEQFASAILAGIRGYFRDYRPHEQVVQRDEDLEGLMRVSTESASSSAARLAY